MKEEFNVIKADCDWFAHVRFDDKYMKYPIIAWAVYP